MAEVVLNKCGCGSFSLSKAASRLYAELAGLPADPDRLHVHFIERHDPALLETVRRLGKAAWGSFAVLEVVALKHGRRYRIVVGGGFERVEEPADIAWKDVDDTEQLHVARTLTQTVADARPPSPA